MEIKVGIRVKVLVSPLPPRVYCSLEDPFFPSLPDSSPPYLLSPLSLSLSSLLRLFPHFGFHFGSAESDIAAGVRHDRPHFFVLSFRLNCCSDLFLAQETTFGRAVPHRSIIFATSWPIIAFRFVPPIIGIRGLRPRRTNAIYVYGFPPFISPLFRLFSSSFYRARPQKRRWWSSGRITAIIRSLKEPRACKFPGNTI